MSLEQAIFSDTKLANAFKAIGPTKLSEVTKYNKNMVLSTIPIDQSKIVIQQSSVVGSRLTAINSQQQQQLGIAQFHRRSPSKIITSTSSQQNQTSNISVASQNITPQIIHSHIQHENHNVSQSTSNHQNTLTKIVGSSSSQQSPSKYVFFQNNGNVQYTSHEAYINTNSTQSNGVGNIVIVATEPMDLNSVNNLTGPIIHTANGPVIHARSNITPNGDEDLTSLTWLQDKNLIKGIVSRSNNSNKNVQTIQPNKTIQTNYKITNGVLSPSIEFIEETAIHGDGTTEEHPESLKQHQLNCNNVKNEYTLEKATNLHSPNKLIQSHQPSNFSSPIRQVQITQPNHNFTTQLSNNNNSRLIKNHVLSTVSTTFPSTSPNIVQEHANNNLSTLGATTTVHVGPSGTTTVVEYKTKPNSVATNSRHYTNEYPSSILNSNQNIIVPTKNHSISTNMFSQNNVILSTSIQSNSNQPVIDSTPNQINQNTYSALPSNNHHEPSLSSITTHHPHKKYLREQMNGLEQNNISSNNTLNSGNEELTNNMERDYRRNNDDENQNTTRQFSSLSSAAPLNYSSSKRISPTVNKIHSMNSPHPEYITYSASDFNNALKSNQVIYKDYEIDATKEPNKTGSMVSLPTISKISTKEQFINSCTPVLASSSKQKHPNNIPYDPKAHANAKPPYSFSSLIFMAIEDSTEKALPVKEIYAWIVQHFPYFKTAPTGWKNSVRHNLSLNKSFLKVEKAPNMGKGSLWRVEQHQRPNLIQALTRSPFYPCPAVDKLSPLKNPNAVKVTSVTETYSLNDLESSPTTPVKSNLDAKLFPKLSKLMKEMGNVKNEKSSPFPDNNVEIDSIEQCEYQSDVSSYSHNVSSNNSSIDEFLPQNGNSTPNFNNNVQKLARDCGADSIDDVNAATAMLALKHGSKIFSDNFNNGTPVITNSPSADHTYSAGNGNNSGNLNDCTSAKTTHYDIDNKTGSDNISTSASSDAAYESSDESHNLTPDELEHQRRFEGVDALLSLSSVCSQSPAAPTAPNFSNLKRPATEYIEDHKTCMENIPYLNGKGVSGGSLDEGYNTQGNYSQMSSLSTTKSIPTVSIIHTPSSPLPKKLKSSRLRTKIKQIKRKTASLR